MKIAYTNTPGDLIAFTRYQSSRSPAARRAQARVLWTLPAIMLGLSLILYLTDTAPRWALRALVFAVVYLLTYPLFRRVLLRWGLRGATDEGMNRAVLCEHTLEIQPEGLREVTEFSDGIQSWSAIERIETTDTHTFIYTQANMAHAIPHREVPADELMRFRAAALDAVDHAHLG